MVADSVGLYYGYAVTKKMIDEISKRETPRDVHSIDEYFCLVDEGTEYEYENEKQLVINDTGYQALDIVKCQPCGCYEKKLTEDTPLFVVGIELKRYYRKRQSHCESGLLCDECFNMTENGPYDFDQILKKLTVVDPTHVCNNCHHHKRNSKPCQKCLYERSTKCNRFNREHYLDDDNEVLSHMSLVPRFMHSEIPIPREYVKENCKFYLISPDCTSCT